METGQGRILQVFLVGVCKVFLNCTWHFSTIFCCQWKPECMQMLMVHKLSQQISKARESCYGQAYDDGWAKWCVRTSAFYHTGIHTVYCSYIYIRWTCTCTHVTYSGERCLSWLTYPAFSFILSLNSGWDTDFDLTLCMGGAMSYMCVAWCVGRPKTQL